MKLSITNLSSIFFRYLEAKPDPTRKTNLSLMIKSIFILFILLAAFNVKGQDLSETLTKGEQLYTEKKHKEAILLLEESINKSNTDSRINLLQAYLWLAKHYMHSYQTKAAKVQYGIAWGISQEVGNDSLLLEAGMALTTILTFQEKSDSVKLLTDKLLEIENLKYSDRSDLYVQLSEYYEDKEKLDSAIYYCTLASEIDSIHQDSSSIPFTYNILGNYYISIYNYKNGISNILYGLDFIRGERDLHKRLKIELNLSNIYYLMGNVVKSKQIATESLKSAKEHQFAVSETNAYNMLGNCAAYMDRYEEALHYYEMSDSVNSAKWKNKWRGIRAKASIIEQKLNLGKQIDGNEVQRILDSFDGTETDILKNKVDFLVLRLSDYSLSKFKKEYARIYIESQADKNTHLRLSLLKIKKEYLGDNGLYKDALIIEDEIVDIKKQINLANNKYIIQDLEAKHRKKEQAIEIKNLGRENASKQKILVEQNNKLIIGAIALGLISLLSFFLFRLYRQVRSQKEVISKALSEKDLLLREIHHRVKNNLQLVSSLLTLQGRSIDDATALQAINEGKSRVRSMALIHQDLYNKENLTGIGVKEYIEKLTQELFSTYRVDRDCITLHLDVEDMELDVDTLVPLGLIINELITNSLKYAFPEDDKGTLSLHLSKSNNTLQLKISDNGIGYDSTTVRDNSFGSTLINALTEQLEGKMEISNEEGTQVQISIPSL